MNTITFESSRKMRKSTTLKSVLNRQSIALGFGRSLEEGLFDCSRKTSVGTAAPTVTFKPFERVYQIPKKNPALTLRAS